MGFFCLPHEALRVRGSDAVSVIGGFLVLLTSRMKPQTLVLQFLKMVCPEFVPSDIQMCLELLPSGGFVVSLIGVKLQTFRVSVTALQGDACGVVCSSRWVGSWSPWLQE